MADFATALAVTEHAEGGWCHDPGDSGGETFWGISRVNWPQWGGWTGIDAAKGRPNFPASINNDAALLAQVAAFYRANFWNPIQGDALTNQSAANAVFDAAVNTSVREATILAQRAVPAVTIDGVFGPATLKAINGFGVSFLRGFRYQRVLFYARLYAKDPARYEPFLESWMARACA